MGMMDDHREDDGGSQGMMEADDSQSLLIPVNSQTPCSRLTRT